GVFERQPWKIGHHPHECGRSTGGTDAKQVGIGGIDPRIGIIKIAIIIKAYVLSRIANEAVVEIANQGRLAAKGINGVKRSLSRPVKGSTGRNRERFDAAD